MLTRTVVRDDDTAMLTRTVVRGGGTARYTQRSTGWGYPLTHGQDAAMMTPGHDDTARERGVYPGNIDPNMARIRVNLGHIRLYLAHIEL